MANHSQCYGPNHGQDFSVLYTRFVWLLEKLRIDSGDGNFTIRLTQLAKTDVTILDD